MIDDTSYSTVQGAKETNTQVSFEPVLESSALPNENKMIKRENPKEYYTASKYCLWL